MLVVDLASFIVYPISHKGLIDSFTHVTQGIIHSERKWILPKCNSDVKLHLLP